MNNTKMALSYLRQAEERLHHAKEALERGSYPYVIRQCQEAVELLQVVVGLFYTKELIGS